MQIPKKGFTHGGTFHADDVFSTALLKILNPDFTYERGFEIPENFDGIIYDIGCGEFDHHQPDNEIRPNGIPYASFGKLWKEFGSRLFPQEECERLDKNFVQHIDETDNTGKPNALASVINLYNPVWDSERSHDECFAEAVEDAIKILEKQFENLRANMRAKSIVQCKLYDMRQNIGLERHILVLDQYVPFISEVLLNKDVLFVVFPSIRGGFMIQTVPVPQKNNAVVKRCDFPSKWLNASKEQLDKYQKGLFFCHKANYVASADTKEHAVSVAKIAISEFMNKHKCSIKDIISKY